MQNKLRQLVISALMRNPLTTNYNLHIAMTGYDVTVLGDVDSSHSISEVIATIESVSPYLHVNARLNVVEKELA